MFLIYGAATAQYFFLHAGACRHAKSEAKISVGFVGKFDLHGIL